MQLTVAMREAASVYLGALSELVKSDKEVKKGGPSDPVPWLDQLAALFRDVDFPTTTSSTGHPCVAALSDAWPVLHDVMNKSVHTNIIVTVEWSPSVHKECCNCLFLKAD